MTQSAESDVIARFRSVLARDLGLAFDDGRLGHLSEVLSARAASHGGDVEAYLDRLEREPSPEELSTIAREVTVAETYFFRHVQQFDALRSLLLCHSASPLRILSAGCASGEEAYSLVMLMREIWPDRECTVLAVDVNLASLEKAQKARYSPWSLRETPPLSVKRWFRQEGRDFVVDDSIQRAVRFVRGNLAGAEPELLAPCSLDIIWCRNVLMYFTPEKFRAAVRQLSRALVADGHLFLGSAETLRGISQEFHLCHTHGAFYYRRKTERELSVQPPAIDRAEQGWRRPPPDVEVSAWMEEISRAAARITALTLKPAETRPVLVVDDSPSTSASRKAHRSAELDLSPALDLLHREQFSAALDRVRALPADAARDPEAMLLEAVLLASGDRLAEAEEVCQRLLGLDELNAGAHYVLALCSAGGGRVDRATHHDRVAMYLDPAFAMPRLHLGLLMRRGGDRRAARVELAQARTLLEREDSARLLMFGGGFNRSALLALCSAEIELTGGSA